MELSFKHIDEKDVDMLVMDRLAAGGELLSLLTNLVSDEIPGDPSDYELIKVCHSATTRNGESDLVAVLKSPENVHAILIEDKVDAPAQHQQAKRYERRGREGVDARDWDTFSVVLIAPEDYLESNQEPYPHVLSYQRIRDSLEADDEFGRRMLSDAIAKQAAGWQQSRDEVMSAFYDVVAKTADEMRIKAKCLHKEGTDRAWGTAWVNFESPLAGASISWKSNQGCVVLEFSGWGKDINALKALVGEIPTDAYWRKPAKGIKAAFLCIDALDEVTDWAKATADAPLIVDALYKVQHGEVDIPPVKKEAKRMTRGGKRKEILAPGKSEEPVSGARAKVEITIPLEKLSDVMLAIFSVVHPDEAPVDVKFM